MRTLFTAICLLSWPYGAALMDYIPIEPMEGRRLGEVPWILEATYHPERVHISRASVDKFEKYRELTCRKSENEDEYMNQYFEWEEIEFNKALRDTLVNGEKELNSPMGHQIMRTVSKEMLDTKYTSKCRPPADHETEQEKVDKFTANIKEMNEFEDDLINRSFQNIRTEKGEKA
ncbi:hypothetical protein QR680_004125 [Steinernema hermaphroditum]|uniref:Cathepsin propeptide inhibitor domain-containing protein n=1 Tax=Steinernema hermaphroditum TaxID=289476 RepID=A0AA39HPZ9_9BILA|nr:hypothetical protein QR680_004125 [Steinernema hermaphroditum]